MSKASVERGAVSDFGNLRSDKRGGFRWRRRLRTVKTRLTLAFRGGQTYTVAGSESIMEIPDKYAITHGGNLNEGEKTWHRRNRRGS